MIPAATATVSAVGVLEAMHGAGVIGLTIYNMVSDQGPGSRKSASQMADDLQAEVGKNRVSANTPTHQVNIDLKGKAHFDKATGKKIPTPHVQTAKINRGPNGKTNLSDENTRPATNADIRTARKIVKRK